MQFHPGLKLWSTNSDLISEAAKLIEAKIFHYVELMPVPNTEINPFLNYDIPYVIHTTTENFGVNIADPTKYGYNMQTIDRCIDWADQLSARYIILHPGYGDINVSKKFLTEICDKRLLIENMPKIGINGEKMIGYDVEQINELCNAGNAGFCFDLNHAIKAAVSLNVNYKHYLEEFSCLQASMYHISDGKLSSEIDEHLSLGDGDYKFETLKKDIFHNKSKIIMITLETPKSQNLENDIANLKKLEKLLINI